MRTYFETQYSIDGKTWLRFMDRYATLYEADRFAEAKRNEEIELRVARVTVEVIKKYPKLPGRKAKPVVLPGLGAIEVKGL